MKRHQMKRNTSCDLLELERQSLAAEGVRLTQSAPDHLCVSEQDSYPDAGAEGPSEYRDTFSDFQFDFGLDKEPAFLSPPASPVSVLSPEFTLPAPISRTVSAPACLPLAAQADRSIFTLSSVEITMIIMDCVLRARQHLVNLLGDYGDTLGRFKVKHPIQINHLIGNDKDKPSGEFISLYALYEAMLTSSRQNNNVLRNTFSNVDENQKMHVLTFKYALEKVLARMQALNKQLSMRIPVTNPKTEKLLGNRSYVRTPIVENKGSHVRNASTYIEKAMTHLAELHMRSSHVTKYIANQRLFDPGSDVVIQAADGSIVLGLSL